MENKFIIKGYLSPQAFITTGTLMEVWKWKF